MAPSPPPPPLAVWAVALPTVVARQLVVMGHPLPATARSRAVSVGHPLVGAASLLVKPPAPPAPASSYSPRRCRGRHCGCRGRRCSPLPVVFAALDSRRRGAVTRRRRRRGNGPLPRPVRGGATRPPHHSRPPPLPPSTCTLLMCRRPRPATTAPRATQGKRGSRRPARLRHGCRPGGCQHGPLLLVGGNGRGRCLIRTPMRLGGASHGEAPWLGWVHHPRRCRCHPRLRHHCRRYGLQRRRRGGWLSSHGSHPPREGSVAGGRARLLGGPASSAPASRRHPTWGPRRRGLLTAPLPPSTMWTRAAGWWKSPPSPAAPPLDGAAWRLRLCLAPSSCPSRRGRRQLYRRPRRWAMGPRSIPQCRRHWRCGYGGDRHERRRGGALLYRSRPFPSCRCRQALAGSFPQPVTPFLLQPRPCVAANLLSPSPPI